MTSLPHIRQAKAYKKALNLAMKENEKILKRELSSEEKERSEIAFRKGWNKR